MTNDVYWKSGFDMGNRYLKESFKEPEVFEEMRYSNDMLCIGKKIDGRPFYLDLREACRIIIVGITRSGKTFSMRSMMDRLYATGTTMLHLNDCKNEFYSSKKPAHPKFHHHLLKNEVPRGLKVVALRPTFFKSVNPHLPKDNYWFSIDFKRMTQNDFFTLMNSEQITHNQRIFLDIIYKSVFDFLKKNPEKSFSVELVEDIIETIEDLSTIQRQSLKMKFRPLKDSYFYDADTEVDIVELLKQGFVPALNMENFETFGRGGFLFPEVILSMVLRSIIFAKRNKELPGKLWVFMDEAPRFIANDKKTSIKSLIQESFMLDTRYNVNYCIATQSFNVIPEEIKENSKYIFIPNSLDLQTTRTILMDAGLFRNVQSSTNDAIKIKNRMARFHDYSWLVLNRMTMQTDIVVFNPPLSYHVETGE